MTEEQPRFGLVGYGRFGQLIVRQLASRGETRVHDLAWTSGSRPSSFPTGAVASSLEETAAARNLILSVPIRRLETVLASIVPHLRPGALILDVASVKVAPMSWMADRLPEWVEYVGTHPLFGPDSAPHDLHGQKIVLVPDRISPDRYERLRRFLEDRGLRIIETTAEEHDRAMARTQAFTHWLGRAIADSGAGAEQLDTLGHRLLLEVARFVERDSWELFADMQRFNPFASEVRDRFRAALDELDERIVAEAEPGVGNEPEFER